MLTLEPLPNEVTTKKGKRHYCLIKWEGDRQYGVVIRGPVRREREIAVVSSHPSDEYLSQVGVNCNWYRYTTKAIYLDLNLAFFVTQLLNCESVEKKDWNYRLVKITDIHYLLYIEYEGEIFTLGKTSLFNLMEGDTNQACLIPSCIVNFLSQLLQTSPNPILLFKDGLSSQILSPS